MATPDQCFCTVDAVKVMFFASAEVVIESLYQAQPLTDISTEQINYSLKPQVMAIAMIHQKVVCG